MVMSFMTPAVNPANPTAGLDDLRRRQALAAALWQSGDRPARHWSDGLVSGVNRAAAGWMMGKASREDAALRKGGNEALASLLLGGGGAPSMAPGVTGGAPAAAGPGGAVVPTPVGPSPSSPGGGARAASEIQAGGGIDPTSLDLITRTVLAEAGGEGPEGMAAVANVIRNRMKAGRYGGTTAAGVVKARSQFEPWNTEEGRAKIAAFDPSSPQYQAAAGIVQRIFSGEETDPTQGATHFLAPGLQRSLGRNIPAWARGNPLATIGGHSFYAPEGVVGGGAPAAASATPAAAPSGGMKQALARILQSGNPYAIQAAQPIMAALLKSQLTPGEGFTLAPGQTRYGPNGQVIAQAAPEAGGGYSLTPGQARFDAQGNLVAERPAAPPTPQPFTLGPGQMRYGPNGEVLASGPEKPADSFTLGEGQVRFGPDGRPIAQGPAKPPPQPQPFTLAPGQVRYGPDGKPIAEGPKPQPAPPKFSDITTMRKEAGNLPNVHRYRQAAPILNSIAKSIDKDDRASDLDFVYGMAQIYDPNSVVREGEQVIVQSLGGVPGYVQGWLSHVTQGGKIPASTRRQLHAALARRVQEYRAAADTELAVSRSAAERAGINPEDIMPGLVPLAALPTLPGQPPALPSPESLVRTQNQPAVPPGQPAPSPDEPVARPLNKAEFDKLPSGMLFIAPDGSKRRKP